MLVIYGSFICIVYLINFWLIYTLLLIMDLGISTCQLLTVHSSIFKVNLRFWKKYWILNFKGVVSWKKRKVMSAPKAGHNWLSRGFVYNVLLPSWIQRVIQKCCPLCATPIWTVGNAKLYLSSYVCFCYWNLSKPFFRDLIKIFFIEDSYLMKNSIMKDYRIKK